MELWRRPFLFASWTRWPVKAVQLVVLPGIWLFDTGVLALCGPSLFRIFLCAAITGAWLCGVDINSEDWALDRLMKHRLGDDW